MKDRVRGIIFANDNEDEIIVIKREREGRIYYVFPGGGIEKNDQIAASKFFKNNKEIGFESVVLQMAMKREAKEELGIEIEIDREFFVDNYMGEKVTFLVCRHSGGVIGTGDGPEYSEKSRSERGTYKPLVIKISNLGEIELVPEKVKELVVETFCR